MEICYRVEGDFMLEGKHWYLMEYTLTDTSHDSGPPNGGIVTSFSAGDLIDLALPIGDMDSPLYLDVAAWLTPDIRATDWKVGVHDDRFAGIDFGPAYRVFIQALRDNVELDRFKVAFAHSDAEPIGSQPWGFTGAADMAQHTELGDTVQCHTTPPIGRWKPVKQYQLSWQAASNKGVIYLYFNDGTRETIYPDSIQELAELGNILRSEKPIWFNTMFNYLSTAREPTGEFEE